MAEIKWQNLPRELLLLKQWCAWGYKKMPLGRKMTSVSSVDPNTWLSFQEAKALIAEYPEEELGLGFIFSRDDPYCGVDLDDAINETGDLKDWALRVISVFEPGEAYIEVSPSGKGFHIIGRGKKPGDRCSRNILTKKAERIGKVEMYDNSRYFTMTGNVWDVGYKSIGDSSQAISLIYEKVLCPKPKKLDTNTNNPPEIEVTPRYEEKEIGSAQQIIDIINTTNQASKFNKLLNGTLHQALSDYGRDHSAAVYAFTSIIAFYTDDFKIADELFKRSPLYSNHWAPNPEASGAKRIGKWARLGAAGFNAKRTQLVAADTFFKTNRPLASVDFDSLTDDQKSDSEKKAQSEYERHIDLLYDYYPYIKRDLLTGTLHVRKSPTEGWEPWGQKSILGCLRGACQLKGKGYSKSKMEDYIFHLERLTPKELLLDVPEWDGVDRIKQMAYALNSETLSHVTIADLLKDWCAKFYGKILDPLKVQNRCLILSGAQGVGKDVWVQSMFQGLGVYLSDLTLAGKFTKESDIACVFGTSLLVFISEFDKTRELGIETLKEIITKPKFSLVRKYDRDMTHLTNRASMLGACNPEYVLRDVTGNRRFIVIRLSGGPGEAIDWEAFQANDNHFSLQVISQCKELWTQGYQSCEETESVLKQLTSQYTPEDPYLDIVSEFESSIERRCLEEPFKEDAKERLFATGEITQLLGDIARNYSVPRQTVLSVLKAAGCSTRVAKGRRYGTKAAILYRGIAGYQEDYVSKSPSFTDDELN